MNPEVKELWVSALRSGDYTQGKNLLHIKGDGDEPDKFCCLGVLCAVAVNEGVIAPGKLLGDDPEEEQYYGYGAASVQTSTAFLPAEVRNWSGVNTDNGEFKDEKSPFANGKDSLVRLNDDGISFEDIANVIEEKF